MKAWHDKGLKLDVKLTPTESRPQTRMSNVISEYRFNVIVTYWMGYGTPKWETILAKGHSEIMKYKPSFDDPKSNVTHLGEEFVYKLTLSSIDEANPHSYMADTFFQGLVSRLWMVLPVTSTLMDIRVQEQYLWTYTDDEYNGADHAYYKTAPFPFAKYFDYMVPYTIEPQAEGKNYCAIAIINFLRQWYGLPEMTQEELAGDYVDKFYISQGKSNPRVAKRGMLSSNIIPYVKLYFNTIEGNFGYDYFVTNHYLLMSELGGTGNVVHSILIIGYEGDDVVYYDPLDGRQHKTDVGNVLHDNRIIITGPKK